MGDEGNRETCDECGLPFDPLDLRDSLYHLTHRDDVPPCRAPGGEPIRGVAVTRTPFGNGAPPEHRGPATPEHVDQCLEVLRAMWILIAVRQRDAVAADIQQLGERLKAAREAEDWATCREVIAEVREWLATQAGVVSSRMVAYWERI